MTDKKSGSEHRRRLLKGLLLGGVTSAYILPERWIKPVVEAVHLPAHAQVSMPEEECPTLTIPGITFSCNDPPDDAINLYQVDDTGDCPVLLNPSSVGDNTSSDVISVQDFSFGAAGRNVSVAGVSEVHEIQDCSSPILMNVPFTRSAPFDALSGAPWSASYTVSGNGDGVTVSDITLAPA